MKKVYEGRVFSVEVGEKRFPNGQTHEVEIVRHAPSVVLIPIDGEQRVVLVRQYRHSVRQHLWELPAGSVNPGERPDEAAARECEEEIGRRPHRVGRVAALYPTPGYCDEEMLFFTASDLRHPPPDSPYKPDDDEYFEVQAFTLTEARAMVSRGEIVDLKTAYGLTLV